jgi:ABC-type dipeptide/oligopeptide/nickel transport system permease component
MVPVLDRSITRAIIVIGQRILDGLLTAWVTVTFTFFALRVAAGDPLASLLSQGLVNPAQVEQIRTNLGLDQPLLTQYVQFLSSLLRGDLGRSLYTNRPVYRIILEQLPSTVELALTALGIAIFLGITLGTIAAWKRKTQAATFAESISGLATALPVAFTGILAIWLVTFILQSFLRGSDLIRLKDLLLPALVLGFSSSGSIARVVQSGLEESIQKPYILAARARGVSGGLRLFWHALRPALPPVISLGALQAAFLFGGTVVIETVFSRPGLGRLLISSILQGDFPIAQGIVILAALLYTASHHLADIVAILIDPRLESGS